MKSITYPGIAAFQLVIIVLGIVAIVGAITTVITRGITTNQDQQNTVKGY